LAEIDFRIPLGIRPVQTRSIAPTLLALGQLQRGQQRGRLNEQLLAKGEQEAAQAAQIQQALAALGQGQGRQQPGDAGAINVPFQDVSVPQGQVSQELPGGTIGPQALAPGLQPPQQALGMSGQPPVTQEGVLPPTEHVIARAAIRTRLGDPEGGAKELANHKASLDLQKQEIDLVQTKMKAAGNIAAVITSQESLERNRPRLQEIACSIWPNCKIPAIFNKTEFDELKRLGQDSAEEVADDRVFIDQELAKLAAAKEGRLTREGTGKLTEVVKGLSQGARDALGAAGLLRPGVTPSDTEIEAAVVDAQLRRLDLREAEARARFGQQGLPANIQTPLVFVDKLRGALEDVQRTFDKDFVGLFKGPAGALRERIAGETVSAQEIEFRQALNLAQELWARVQSGAAINAGELVRFGKQIGTQNVAPNVLTTRVEGMLRLLQRHEGALIDVGTITREEAQTRRARGESIFQGTTVDDRALTPAAAPVSGTPKILSIRRIN